MSEPSPPPAATPARKLGRIDFIFLALFVLAIVGTVVWGLFWKRLDYRSVIVEERAQGLATFREVRVYDQAWIDLPSGVELVLPMTFTEHADNMDSTILQLDVMARSDGKPGEVLVLIETHYSESIDPGQSRGVPTAGGRRVWKRQTGSTLTLDVQPGCRRACYARTQAVIFVTPPGQSFHYEPRGSPAFSARFDEDEERSKAAGWDFVLTRPLSRGRFR